MLNVIGFAGLGTGCLSLLFAILSCALPYWTTQNSSSVDVHTGLWRYCITIHIANVETCDDVLNAVSGEGERKARALQALILIGIILGAVSLVIYGIFLIVKKEEKLIGYTAAGVKFLAGFFLMVLMAYYRGDIYESENDLAYAFYLIIPAWLLSWVAGGLMIGGALKTENGITKITSS